MKQSIESLTDFFIKDKEQLPIDVLYKTRTLVRIVGWIWVVTFLMMILQLLGYFSEATTLFLVIFFSMNLLVMKFTGNKALVSFLLIVGGTLITAYNIYITGQIYSYNHKWFIALLLLVNFSLPKFTLPYLVFTLVFQCYSYAYTPADLQGVGTKEDYFFDSIAYLIISYIFLLVFKKLHRIQKSRIDEQNSRLLKQQQELINSNQLLKDRSEQLMVSNQELERFAYIASHDLKTPLNNIISFSFLLERELKGFENENAHRYFHFIKEGSRKMDNLIKDVLEYSKMSSKGVKSEEIDLNLLVDSVTNSISEYINEKNAEVLITTYLPTIKANKAKMYLLFKNLIENGIKYNQSESPLVEIGCIKKRNILQFQIKDNGIGIEPKYHQSIFEMFSRLHNDSEYEGTGLGLALCKKIVNELEGRIDIISKTGVGSQFVIALDKKHFAELSTQEV